MAGLKSFIYELAHFWQLSPGSLYEKQRELVRGGLLPVNPGRGPGSGTPLTPDTLATFLIGMLATDGLVDLVKYTTALSSARPMLLNKKLAGGRRGGATFHSDLARALGHSEIRGWQPGDDLHENFFMGVQVTRHWRGVILQHRVVKRSKSDEAEGIHGIEYIVSEEARLNSPTITHSASIENEPFWFTCSRLRQYLESEKGESK